MIETIWKNCWLMKNQKSTTNLRKFIRDCLSRNPDVSISVLYFKAFPLFPGVNPRWLRTTITAYKSQFRMEKKLKPSANKAVS